MRRILYVSGFGPNTRARDLAYEFERYGPLVRCDIPIPKGTSATSSAYAFVEFRSSRDADEAYHDMYDRKIDGYRIGVQWAKNPPSAIWRNGAPTHNVPPPPRRRSRSPRRESRDDYPPRRRSSRDRDYERRRSRSRSPRRDDRPRYRERERTPERSRRDERDYDRDREREKDHRPRTPPPPARTPPPKIARTPPPRYEERMENGDRAKDIRARTPPMEN